MQQNFPLLLKKKTKKKKLCAWPDVGEHDELDTKRTLLGYMNTILILTFYVLMFQ